MLKQIKIEKMVIRVDMLDFVYLCYNEEHYSHLYKIGFNNGLVIDKKLELKENQNPFNMLSNVCDFIIRKNLAFRKSSLIAVEEDDYEDYITLYFKSGTKLVCSDLTLQQFNFQF